MPTNNKNALNYDQLFVALKNEWKTTGVKPKLVLHVCCAPCSTYTLAELAFISNLTIYFSNSNIHPEEEYQRRTLATKKFIDEFNTKHQTQVKFVEDEYQPLKYQKNMPLTEIDIFFEGGLRCKACYNLRLDRVAQYAKTHHFDYFGSSLTVSPLKNSKFINEGGYEIALLYNVKYLPTDFKKRGGYQRTIEMSKEYDIYRQCYCGCTYSSIKRGIDLEEIKCSALIYLESIMKI